MYKTWNQESVPNGRMFCRVLFCVIFCHVILILRQDYAPRCGWTELVSFSSHDLSYALKLYEVSDL